MAVLKKQILYLFNETGSYWTAGNKNQNSSHVWLTQLVKWLIKNSIISRNFATFALLW